MSTTFKKEFIANGLCAHIIKRKSGKRTFCYEIRYRSNGYNISASSKDLETAKQKFIAKTVPGEIEKYFVGKNSASIPTTFSSFALYYFKKKRILNVAPETYRNDLNRLNKYLVPYFKEKPLLKITLHECQTLIDGIVEQEKFKTAEELCSLMRCIFRFAINNHLLVHSPTDALIFEGYEQENGIALTLEEERILFAGITEPTFAIALAIGLYTGLRPNEVKSAEIVDNGKFIRAINSKRRKKRRKSTNRNQKEYKWIPISDKLRPYVENGIPALPSPQLIRRRLKNILPDHQLYDLRTTFETRCRSCNIEETALKAMMGQSFGQLGNAYTDVEKLKGYIFQEGKKFEKWDAF
ncbi:MAG: hypothetical protein IJX75_00025 [Clostridia bacterium]|nr:hypothetical protein [Clostridia bacterium]